MDIINYSFNEYLKIVNPHNISHPESAYQMDLDGMNKTWPADTFPLTQQTFMINKRIYQLREKRIDRWEGRYLAHDENGDHKRDKHGELVFLTPEEMEIKIPAESRFVFEHAVIDVASGKVVGLTENEYGCLLVAVAKEFQGQGIGAKLLDFHRSNNPKRYSGGLTNAGYNNLHRFYRNKVLEALGQGYYSQAVRNNALTKNKVNEILKSAEITTATTPVETSRRGLQRIPDGGRDLAFSSTENLLFYSDQAIFILFDKNVLDISDHFCGGKFEHFIADGVKAAAFLGGEIFDSKNKNRPSLMRLYAQSRELESFIIKSVISSLKDEVDEIIMPCGLNQYDTSLLTFENRWQDGDLDISIPIHAEGGMNFPDLSEFIDLTHQYLKKVDQYGEKFGVFLEFVDRLIEEHSIERINNHRQSLKSNRSNNVPR